MKETVRELGPAAGSGIGAYVLGYVFTYVLSGPAVEESSLNQIVEAVGDGGVAWKLVGWVFYNAHGVTTTIDIDIPFLGGTEVLNYIAQGDALSPVLYVLPPALLIAAGLFGARMADATDVGDALRTGGAVTAGYLPLAIAGAFLFTVAVDSSSGGPTLVPAIGLAGLVYPLVFGSIGGAIGATLANSGR
ncbi:MULTISPECIES: hypothetical protein [Halomicrobium]|uniref:DUF7978 domain-containing protein n=2 Tax=Halomicrobium mukohataei TaxID=57705 RepID=C7P437_HALMD|nr:MULTISPECIES: hypothetical protein [Halomicrobium]ACV47859.1 conserved hypothetical protein [Halomicrobium mukohataei DSM 12286]QCD66301.1 hypothetical protein E5139_11850 [Halomicrobium mukohataei]QFR21107.1 hypothetical protein GBQ70_11845 [Halomicrobium sp. ZPS1]